MNICITTKTLARGGAEVLIYNICKKLRMMSYEITVIYFERNVDDLSQLIRDLGCTVELIEIKKFNFPQNVLKYRNKLLTNNFDVVFEHSPIISVMTRLIFMFTSKPTRLIYLEHSVWENYHFITRKLNELTYSLLDEVISCSSKVFESNGRRGVILNNAIDTDISISTYDIPGVEKDDKVIISVANISKVKNHELLLSSFNDVRYEKVKLVLVGAERDNFEKVKQAIAVSKRSRDIIYLGSCHNVMEILSRSNIFSLTSFKEGLPISLLEAMSLGVVPVCTNAGGISSVIVNNINGFVVDDFNSNQLTRHFERILNDEELEDSLSLGAKKTISTNHCLDDYVQKLVILFAGKES